MIDHTRAILLMDLYRDLLTSRQQEILTLYFEEDLSLSEIQENLHISRSAVQNTVAKALQSMEKYEALLHLQQKTEKLEALKEKYPEISEELQTILDL